MVGPSDAEHEAPVARELGRVDRRPDGQQQACGHEDADVVLVVAGDLADPAADGHVALAHVRPDVLVAARRVGVQLEQQAAAVLDERDVCVAEDAEAGSSGSRAA